MAKVEYQAVRGRHFLDPIVTASALRAVMASVGVDAAGIARRYAARPATIQSEPVLSYGRWRVNVWNTSDGALSEEYGTRNLRPTRPLGWALDAVASQDPNRKR
ncbi:MAG: hypothetical protein J2P17_35045, partial [Mycobacterium sp.]|nr:hypothetical protein [Mycobacterium sp.]